ncbi:hypothetical protein HX017_01515 [Myroides marinus]|uniref:Uncharacterized protein n=1 Tax=Myroides marinus TaxID=703342 RepID=A0A161S9R0_9FLAO|nr:hypothetical protein [Myroides marinus]KUF39365.1 hypothetical protein AS361_01935 [Myroides marinus]KZE76555.1 hypothetical protein AV926_15530 [Myroides marinus]MDM1345802.1 hypothetical protein [Myroides marinus]MDM1349337.1 hypothetical protein [Myroides marinus]MDM1352985.1 hypothetical protein [Myroides marinus]
MYEVTIFIVVAFVVFMIARKFFSIKSFDTKEEYLQYKREKEKALQEEEEEWDDDFIDKQSFNFLFAGAVATILFLVFGLFTGNSFYFILMIFIITAVLYLYFFPPTGKF